MSVLEAKFLATLYFYLKTSPDRFVVHQQDAGSFDLDHNTNVLPLEQYA